MFDINIAFANDRNTFYGPYNRCIYCGDDSDPENLTDEHAVPYMLGFRIILQKASCECCQKFTSAFESKVANEMFAAVLAYIGMQKRKGKRNKRRFPVRVLKDGEWRTERVPIKDYPTMLHLVSFGPPGILRDEPPSSEFKDTHWWGWSLGDDFDDKMKRLRDTKSAENIRIDGTYHARAFGQLLAKIAHCFAVAHFGLSSFNPLLPSVIRDETAPIAYFVGAESAGLPVDDNVTIRHELNFSLRTHQSSGHTLLCCNIKLFAWLETPNYLVVVGEPGPEILQQLNPPRDSESV